MLAARCRSGDGVAGVSGGSASRNHALHARACPDARLAAPPMPREREFLLPDLRPSPGGLGGGGHKLRAGHLRARSGNSASVCWHLLSPSDGQPARTRSPCRQSALTAGRPHHLVQRRSNALACRRPARLAQSRPQSDQGQYERIEDDNCSHRLASDSLPSSPPGLARPAAHETLLPWCSSSAPRSVFTWCD